KISIEETTNYPFSDTIKLKISTSKPAAFPLYLRVPGWATTTDLKINGQSTKVQAKADSFIVIDRTWTDGDTVSVRFPMHVRLHFWKATHDAVSVSYGPLSYSLDIKEKWVDT